MMNGPTVYGGYACDASLGAEAGAAALGLQLRARVGRGGDPRRCSAAPTDEDYEATAKSRACFPGDKAENAWDAGWRNILLINRHLRTASGRR